MTRRNAQRCPVGGKEEFRLIRTVRIPRTRWICHDQFRGVGCFGDDCDLLSQATSGASERYSAWSGPGVKRRLHIARVLHRVTARKGSPAFLGAFPHFVTCVVTVILRTEHASARNGIAGSVVGDRSPGGTRRGRPSGARWRLAGPGGVEEAAASREGGSGEGVPPGGGRAGRPGARGSARGPRRVRASSAAPRVCPLRSPASSLPAGGHLTDPAPKPTGGAGPGRRFRRGEGVPLVDPARRPFGSGPRVSSRWPGRGARRPGGRPGGGRSGGRSRPGGPPRR